MERNTHQNPSVTVCCERSGLWLALMWLQLARCLCRSQVAWHGTGMEGYSRALALHGLVALPPASPCDNLFNSTER